MRALLAVSTLTLLLAACGTQTLAPEQKPSDVVDGSSNRVGNEGIPVTPPPQPGETFDPESEAALSDSRSLLSKRNIYFDYDSYAIKPEFQPILEAHAKFLSKNKARKIMIQGNADERGSREYNLALGQKRAEAVKKTLGLMGVREEQLESVSLGEEKPVCSDATEDCWAKNRRGEILYSGREF
ncbi:MAG TPA: peptidoglycan-associated lipoprotein Pal [Rhodocyclaceae bacterium]|nr:peptidoglycan-associated lipoprotein Pal [Rhodocyclaceae bacterium]